MGRVKTRVPAEDLPDDWWTTGDIAAYLGIEPGTWRTYRSDERLRSTGYTPEPERTVGQTLMWRPATIIDWAKRRKRRPVG